MPDDKNTLGLPKNTCPITGTVSDTTTSLYLMDLRLRKHEKKGVIDLTEGVHRESEVIPGMFPEPPYKGP